MSGSTPSRLTIKQPAIASRGMVTSNHPLASLAGTEVMLRGGNAVDAAIATMFALTVVEPMMVTIFGAGFVNIRWSNGECVTIDNYAVVPSAATPDMFRPIAGSLDHDVEGRDNEVGHRSVAVGGTLMGWAHAVDSYGRMPLADVVAPAVRFARDGFRASPYLCSIIQQQEDDIRRYPETAKVFLPNGAVPVPGELITRPEYGDTLEAIGNHGPGYLYGGPLGHAIAEDMAANGGVITLDDILDYRIYERPPVRGSYRGHEIISMGPPSSGGTHIIQMLKIFEGFDIAAMGFGTADGVHLTAEAMKMAFADRFRYMADPATTDVPVDWIVSERYAAERRAQVDMSHAQDYAAGITPDREHASTTHCCAMDADGNIVSTTNTLHHGFGSKVTVPGTGMLLNNCMQLMDPVPGHTNSIAPGKRILSSMSPTTVLKDGQPFLTLGAVGGLRIFGAVFQAIVNVIDHRMPLQEAVEAPRSWSRAESLELEEGFSGIESLEAEMADRGHRVERVFKVGGGMNGIHYDADTRMMTGAACWRADGAPVGVSGGEAVVDPDIARAMWR
jgi:gamma-glutamyltranspeptidase / glutathione hydrolase